MNRQEIDFHIDLLQAILWQYNDASNLIGLIQKKQDWYNSEYEQFWRDWYDNVFNLDTCNDFGATVWAIILGIQFVAISQPNASSDSIGFEPEGNNFYESNFGSTQTTAIEPTLEQKRLILKLRYFQLISRGTVPETNLFMQKLFGDRGLVYVEDLYDMTFAVYVFTFQPDADILYVLNNYDLLPRPAGVGVKIQVVTRNSFGFDPEGLNFDSTFEG